MADVSKPELDKLKDDYLGHLTLREFSPLTRRQIDLSLRIFLGFLKGRGIFEIQKVERQTIEDYKAYLSVGFLGRRGKPLVVGTVQSRLYNVQGWFKWLKKKGFVYSDPAEGVKRPKCVKRLPRGVLTKDEIRRVMEQPNLALPLGYRDRTIMEVLYSTGIRAAELINLEVGDLDLKKKVLRVRKGKGGRDRFAPLSTPSCRFLERYLAEVRPELAEGMRPCGNSWLKKQGTGGNLVFLSMYGGPFSRAWLGQLMQGYLHKAGITRPVSPVHGFRHSVATHLIEDGMDVRYVQVMLGHESINSTQIYTHVERATLSRRIKACHPRALVQESVKHFVEEKRHAIPA